YIEHFRNPDGSSGFEDLLEDKLQEAADISSPEELADHFRYLAKDLDESLNITATEDYEAFPEFVKQFSIANNSMKSILRTTGVAEEDIARYVADPQEMSNLLAKFKSSIRPPGFDGEWDQGFEISQKQTELMSELEAELPAPTGFFREGSEFEGEEDYARYKARETSLAKARAEGKEDEYWEEQKKQYETKTEPEEPEGETESEASSESEAEAAEVESEVSAEAGGAEASSSILSVARLAATFNKISNYFSSEEISEPPAPAEPDEGDG
ncbi:MAG TPA: hypothetical protein VGF75_05135, partial [Candidatus Saccharimonadales bacterium]